MKAFIFEVRVAVEADDEFDFSDMMDILNTVEVPPAGQVEKFNLIGLQLLHVAPIKANEENSDVKH